MPEDVEVPVGLDQDMIIVKMPADKTYVASDEILEQMKELDLLDSVAAVGMEQKACTVPEIAEKMQVNEDEDEADAEVIYGGSFEKPELKALNSIVCSFGIMTNPDHINLVGIILLQLFQ